MANVQPFSSYDEIMAFTLNYARNEVFATIKPNYEKGTAILTLSENHGHKKEALEINWNEITFMRSLVNNE